MSIGFKMGVLGSEKPRTETYNVTENGTFDMGEKNLYRYVNANVATGKSVIITANTSNITINYADYGITIPDGYAPLIIPLATYPPNFSYANAIPYFENTPTRTSANIKVDYMSSDEQINILLTVIKAKSWGSLCNKITTSGGETVFTIDVPINKLMVVPIAFQYVQRTYVTSSSSTQSKYSMMGVSGYSGNLVRNIMYYEIE